MLKYHINIPSIEEVQNDISLAAAERRAEDWENKYTDLYGDFRTFIDASQKGESVEVNIAGQTIVLDSIGAKVPPENMDKVRERIRGIMEEFKGGTLTSAEDYNQPVMSMEECTKAREALAEIRKDLPLTTMPLVHYQTLSNFLNRVTSRFGDKNAKETLQAPAKSIDRLAAELLNPIRPGFATGHEGVGYKQGITDLVRHLKQHQVKDEFALLNAPQEEYQHLVEEFITELKGITGYGQKCVREFADWLTKKSKDTPKKPQRIPFNLFMALRDLRVYLSRYRTDIPPDLLPYAETFLKQCDNVFAAMDLYKAENPE